MRKTITKIICAAAAAISVAGLALTAGCGAYTTEGVSPDTYTTVTSNGGFAVQTDEYVYFINGYELNTADNTFGKPVKGSIMRISKTDMQNRNYAAAQTVVPVVAFSGQHEAGLYVYGDRIYYATPSTARNSTGVVQSSNLEFKSSTLDGKETMSDYYFRSTSTALDYRYVEVGETVYLLYAQSESLYGEETAVTNIHSVNTATGEDTLLAYDAASYSFDESDPTNPYVYYTMGVTYRLGSANAVEEGYNQLYAVRADATEAKTYDFSYVEDYDAESNPLYVNCGDLVYDGIGMDSYNMRYNQFNYGYGGDEKYAVNRTDTEYTIGRYSDGVLFFSAQSTLDSAEGLYMLENSKVDSDGDGRVDESWNAITANDSITDYRLLIDGDDTEYSFYTANGVTYALFIDEGGLSRCTFENGERTERTTLSYEEEEGELELEMTIERGLSLIYLREQTNENNPTNSLVVPKLTQHNGAVLYLAENNSRSYGMTPEEVRQHIRFENFAEHAIGSAGDPTSSESGEVFPIIPWLLTKGNWCNNLSSSDGNGQSTYFVAVNGDNEIISPYRTPCALADAASSDMNVSCWSKSFAIMEDKTINALYKGATNKDQYNDMGEGRTLTITSGGVILSRYGSIGSEATCGGAAGRLNFPNRAYITMVFKESGDTKRGIWAPMTSPNGCSYGNLTTLDTYLGGDQTGIDGDLTVNYGSLVLGTAETPAQLDCTVNLVGKKTKLTVVSPENFDPYASDINFVDIIGENAVVQMDSDAVIRKLQIDGVSLPRGQYSAENLPSRITGGGVLTVRLDDEKRGSMLLLK